MSPETGSRVFWGDTASSRGSGAATCSCERLMGAPSTTLPFRAATSFRVGTLNAILSEVAEHFGVSRDEIAEQLYRLVVTSMDVGDIRGSRMK